MRKLVLVGSGVPAWDWTEEMRGYFAAEEAAIDAGDLAAATQVNLDFWVKPEHHDEVRPQQLRALELQSAHPEPELIWPELRAALDAARCRRSWSSATTTRTTSRRSPPTWRRESQDSELVVVPGAGHLVGVDQPEELNALLLEFLLS